MKNDNRVSGIDIIGNIPWGTHFCQFYHTKEDLLDILIPYFKAGLENNEFSKDSKKSVLSNAVLLATG